MPLEVSVWNEACGDQSTSEQQGGTRLAPPFPRAVALAQKKRNSHHEEHAILSSNLGKYTKQNRLLQICDERKHNTVYEVYNPL
jgi:hypothetical protein